MAKAAVKAMLLGVADHGGSEANAVMARPAPVDSSVDRRRTFVTDIIVPGKPACVGGASPGWRRRGLFGRSFVAVAHDFTAAGGTYRCPESALMAPSCKKYL